MPVDPEALARAARAPVEIKKDIQKEMSMEMSIGPTGGPASRRCHVCGGWFAGIPTVDGVEAFGAACETCAILEERERHALAGPDDDPRDPGRRFAPTFARTFRAHDVQQAVAARTDLLPAQRLISPPPCGDGRRSWTRLQHHPTVPRPRRLGDPTGF